MYVFLVTLAVLCAIMLLRLSVFVEYTESGFSGFVKILFIKIRVPRDKKKPQAGKKKETGKKSGSISEFKHMIKPLLSALGKLVKTIKIKKLCADIKIASGDAFNTAMTYGKTAVAVGMAVPIIENNLKVKKKCITTEADFEAEQSTIYFSADMSVAMWQILAICARLAYRLIKVQNINGDKNDEKGKGRKKDGRACIK